MYRSHEPRPTHPDELTDAVWALAQEVARVELHTSDVDLDWSEVDSPEPGGWGLRARIADGCYTIGIAVRAEGDGLAAEAAATYTHQTGRLSDPDDDDPVFADEAGALAYAYNESRGTAIAVWDITGTYPLVAAIVYDGQLFRPAH